MQECFPNWHKDIRETIGLVWCSVTGPRRIFRTPALADSCLCSTRLTATKHSYTYCALIALLIILYFAKRLFNICNGTVGEDAQD